MKRLQISTNDIDWMKLTFYIRINVHIKSRTTHKVNPYGYRILVSIFKMFLILNFYYWQVLTISAWIGKYLNLVLNLLWENWLLFDGIF